MKISVNYFEFLCLGFPTPAAYAAYTGRGYSSYPGFGLAGGIAGYPAGKSISVPYRLFRNFGSTQTYTSI